MSKLCGWLAKNILGRRNGKYKGFEVKVVWVSGRWSLRDWGLNGVRVL